VSDVRRVEAAAKIATRMAVTLPQILKGTETELLIEQVGLAALREATLGRQPSRLQLVQGEAALDAGADRIAAGQEIDGRRSDTNS